MTRRSRSARAPSPRPILASAFSLMDAGMTVMDAAMGPAHMQMLTPQTFLAGVGAVCFVLLVSCLCRSTTPGGDYFLKAQVGQILAQQLQEQLPEILQTSLQPVMDSLTSQVAEDKFTEVLQSTLQPLREAVEKQAADASPYTADEAKTQLQKLLETYQVDMETQLKSLRDDMEGIHGQQIRAVGKEVEALQTQLAQAMQKANTAEQGRFGTLDGALKTRFDALEAGVKSRIDLLNNDFNQKLDGVDKALKQTVQDLGKAPQDIKAALDKVDATVVAWDKACTKLMAHCDRTENMLREKFGSLQGDTNKIIGETAQLGRDWQSSLRSNTKALDSLQQAVATMGAALSNRPLDSTGVTEAVEIGRNMQNQISELVNQATETTGHLREVRDQLRQPRVAEVRSSHQETAPAAAAAPSIINLASRIPPTTTGGLVRVILSNGREVLTSEDEVLGPPAFPYGSRR